MKKSTWQILRKGDQSELTLTVDFTSTGRTQACFRDLVPMVETTGDIWETVAPPTGEHRSGEDYVARWVRGVQKRERVVSTVIGYCVGAVYAAPLAERLAELQGSAPRLIVLDPELPNIAGLYRDFHGAGGALTTILTPEELTKFHADGEAVREKYGLTDITLIGPALSGIFRSATEVAGVRLGLDEDLRAELGDSFASFVAYLRAATEIDPLPVWRQAAAITSVHSTQREFEFAENVRLEVDHDQMLRHQDVAAAVSRLMAAPGPDLRLAG